jgi:2-phospho-L-lactate guanylyltransferase
MSGFWAVVPAKDFAKAKCRLSPVLDRGERAIWARETLDHVLAILAAAGLPVLVVTDAQRVVEHVEALGAHSLLSVAGIGDAVRQGVVTVGLRGAESALVVMGDLPDLNLGDVRTVLVQPQAVVICPDERDAGTNGLLLRQLDPLSACFGHVDSFARHLAANPGAGVVRTLGWGRDVDTPADLEFSPDRPGAGRATTSGTAR